MAQPSGARKKSHVRGDLEDWLMAIDFTLSEQQRQLQLNAREFAQTVLAPVVREADAEPDPLRAFQLTKPAYTQPYNPAKPFSIPPTPSAARPSSTSPLSPPATD